MEKTFDLVELTNAELKEISGGWALSIIALLFPSASGVANFCNGIRDGYLRTTMV